MLSDRFTPKLSRSRIFLLRCRLTQVLFVPAGREGHRPRRHRREAEGVRLESAQVWTGDD